MAIIHPLSQISDRNIVPTIPQVVFYGHDPKVNGEIVTFIYFFFPFVLEIILQELLLHLILLLF